MQKNSNDAGLLVGVTSIAARLYMRWHAHAEHGGPELGVAGEGEQAGEEADVARESGGGGGGGGGRRGGDGGRIIGRR